MGAPVKSALLAALFLLSTRAQAAVDPTAPPGSGAPGAGAPAPAELRWIRVNGRQSLAWYGGTAVRLGDVVAEGRVVEIREDYIVIAGKRGRRIVHLLDPGARARFPNNKH